MLVEPSELVAALPLAAGSLPVLGEVKSFGNAAHTLRLCQLEQAFESTAQLKLAADSLAQETCDALKRLTP